MRNTVLIAGVASACGVGFVALIALSLGPKDTSNPIFSREIIEYEMLDEGVVRYAYQGEIVPEKIVEDEVPTLRTESSYTRKLGENESGSVFEARVYAGKAYVKDGRAWHYRETATTTEELFSASMWRNPLAMLFIPRVYAADIYSGAGDGEVYNSNSNFTVTRTATSGAGVSSAATVFSVGTQRATSQSNYLIERGFLPFDTSSLPVSAQITSASISIKANLKHNEDDDAQAYITIVTTSQATHTTLVNEDYDQVGATEQIAAAQRKDIGAMSTVSYSTFTLNSTGISSIKKSGQASSCSSTAAISCFGLREGHDLEGSSITTGAVNDVRFYASEQSGTSDDPYLSVTYTAPVSISTDAASSITPTGATLNATVSDVGSGNPSTCGFAWGTNSALSGGDTATTTDSTCPGGAGSFTRDLAGLVTSTTYYFRAYAINVDGTGYGSIQTFSTTEPLPPEMRLKGGVRLQGSRLLGL